MATTPPDPATEPEPAPAPAASQTFSIVSLVLGVVGLIASVVAVGLLFALAAVIIGHLALRREPAARGMAMAGLATGYTGVAISVVWGIVLLATVLIPLLAVGAFLGG